VKNHRCHEDSAIRLHLSNGDVFTLSARQPLMTADGKVAHASTIQKHWEKKKADTDRKPISLRSLDGRALHVRSARLVHARYTLRWLETAAHSNIFAGNMEASTEMRLKTVLPVSPFDD
jgi:hypothetical protein